MADEEFIIEADDKTVAAQSERTGWETVVFELADEEAGETE